MISRASIRYSRVSASCARALVSRTRGNPRPGVTPSLTSKRPYAACMRRYRRSFNFAFHGRRRPEQIQLFCGGVGYVEFDFGDGTRQRLSDVTPSPQSFLGSA